jgi:hypothetical protein
LNPTGSGIVPGAGGGGVHGVAWAALGVPIGAAASITHKKAKSKAWRR